ncbi:hypothetical protein OUZ56_022702 [Daphnia magna]|uniref:Uncharacterized protein n=1 Tax=Daphnia magna TaxID=35525 RepID=A0ABR0AX75_9CRUS|nr:hypothetical protein OUZ56_022702 [Daphnia magna]
MKKVFQSRSRCNGPAGGLRCGQLDAATWWRSSENSLFARPFLPEKKTTKNNCVDIQWFTVSSTGTQCVYSPV